MDWTKIRKDFFSECVDTLDSSTCRINMAPHDLFEWFRNRILLDGLPVLRTNRKDWQPTSELRWLCTHERLCRGAGNVLQQKFVDVNCGCDEDVPFEWREVPTIIDNA